MLEQSWEAESGAFIPVYGRRRVGKSELLVRFVTGKPAIYVTGKVAPAELQMREFLRSAVSVLREPLLADHPVTDWPATLRLVEDRWKGREKLILALDEFQWMAAASPELPSVLQECWDRQWRHGGIMLILCGSYIGFMEREILGQEEPALRTTHGADSPPPLRLQRSSRVSPALVACGPSGCLFHMRRHAVLPALLLAVAFHRAEPRFQRLR